MCSFILKINQYCKRRANKILHINQVFTVIWKVKNWHEYFLSTSTKEMHFNFLDCNVKSAEMKVNSLNFGIGVVVKWQKKFWDTIKALNYMICLVTHQCSVVLAHMIVILSLCSSTRVHVYHRYNKRKLCQIAPRIVQ